MMTESQALQDFKKHQDKIYTGLHKFWAEFYRRLDVEDQTYFDGKLWHMASQLYAAGIKEWPPFISPPGSE